jgi:ABC-type transport system involved in cytochrome bd biosynthesis fused ATPase/permease subunit
MITKKEKLFLLIIYPFLSSFLGGIVFAIAAVFTDKRKLFAFLFGIIFWFCIAYINACIIFYKKRKINNLEKRINSKKENLKRRENDK